MPNEVNCFYDEPAVSDIFLLITNVVADSN